MKTGLRVSRIYAGPMDCITSNGTSKSLAKKNRGNKSDVWTNKASDRKRTSRKNKNKKGIHVHTPNGVICGYTLHVNDWGMYVSVKGHDYKVVEYAREGIYVQKGYTLKDCKVDQYHKDSAIID
jgi:hypothetical protein